MKRENDVSSENSANRPTGWYVPFDREKTPLRKRKDVVVVSAAAGFLVVAAVGGYALTRGSDDGHPVATGTAAGLTFSGARSSLTVTSSTKVRAAPVAKPVIPTTIKPTTTTTKTTKTTAPTTTTSSTTKTSAKPSTTTPTSSGAHPTTSGAATAPAAAAQGAPTGRFSGVIAAKSGDTWTITGWDGTQTTVRVTPSTVLNPKADILPREQFVPGQTVSVFWHEVGGAMVADRMFGLS